MRKNYVRCDNLKIGLGITLYIELIMIEEIK